MTLIRLRQRLVEGRLRRALLPCLAAEGLLVLGLGALVWHAHSPDRIDRAVAARLYAKPGSALRPVATAVTFFGSPLVVAVGAVLVATSVWWRYRDTFLALFCPTAVTVAALIEQLLKSTVSRARPPTARFAHEVDFSYPSGHTTASVALALSAILLVWAGRHGRGRWFKLVVLALYGFVVGLSRLVLGVHYLTDVVGGALLAAGTVLAVGWACSRDAIELDDAVAHPHG
mgnify:CR=1 FL=1